MAIDRILFWTGFGVVVRVFQLGIEMRPFFHPKILWGYPLFGAVGGSFGYWVQGVDERQVAHLQERKQSILDKRARRAERLAAAQTETEASGSGAA
ncbi:NADH2 dehydrogenase [Staphylotrichum tortipilum]|uniref:NADH2 dehydrogenase n=1 Tax=Staphylotrichum tortipilum TaxID=2831512 RepID=A0AAN6MFL7_9PEZI|nr:NADH2 dehydrogenase [Staphylotrichum longicolle]